MGRICENHMEPRKSLLSWSYSGFCLEPSPWWPSLRHRQRLYSLLRSPEPASCAAVSRRCGAQAGVILRVRVLQVVASVP